MYLIKHIISTPKYFCMFSLSYILLFKLPMDDNNTSHAAIATRSSSSGLTPLTPTAPTHCPLISIGTPPLISTNGALSSAVLLVTPPPLLVVLTLAESSSTPVDLRNNAAVRALPTAISYDAAKAPSIRCTCNGTPPASEMQTVTCHEFDIASCMAASMISCVDVDVRL